MAMHVMYGGPSAAGLRSIQRNSLYDPEVYGGRHSRHFRLQDQVKYGPNNYTCEQYFSGGTAVVTNLRKKLYELDAPDPDDYVTSLNYGTVTVPITCSSAWSCSGWSSWRLTDNGVAGAEVRQVRVRVTKLQD